MIPECSPNLLGFDVEGFVKASYDSFLVPSKHKSEAREAEEIEENTAEILDLRAEFDQRATFFILGRIVGDMPLLVRSIAEAGHEIASHGFHHRRFCKGFDGGCCGWLGTGFIDGADSARLLITAGPMLSTRFISRRSAVCA